MKENHTDKGLVMIVLGFCILNLGLGIYANWRIIKINKENDKVEEKVKKEEVEETIPINEEVETEEVIDTEEVVDTEDVSSTDEVEEIN